ncbi:PRD domain-containing protein [Aerococcus urinae]|uniref:PRD domain-containing protein n=1 Tax=Aerococcus urinae TaxID=1376 RepID=UPI002550D217|nr:PRD domain-containing protein [Aerococcus urinae]MDK6371117.1 PRD domain-containing protein [Aerococcus urinae]
MNVIKKINNNVALAIKDGKECIIVGKGVGFKNMPYTLKDETLIEKIYSDINPVLVKGINKISPTLFNVTSFLFNEAKDHLKIKLSPNFIITLSDHIQFSIKKYKQGIEVPLIFLEDIKYLYPDYFKFSLYALNLINNKLNVNLPDIEASSITLHILNNSENEYVVDQKEATFILEIVSMIENTLSKSIEKDSYEFNRFIAHLKMLFLRESSDRLTPEIKSDLYDIIFSQSPLLSEAVTQISNHFKMKLNRHLNEEEQVYLAIYLNRLMKKEE